MIPTRYLVILALALAVLACSDSSDAPAPTPAPQPTPTPAEIDEPPASPPAPEAPGEASEPAAGLEDPTPIAAGDAVAGRADYQTLCSSCHGTEGAGDGPVAATLDPKPAKHSDGAFMNTLSDEYLFSVIKEGGAAVGKSAMMAPWGGTVTDEQIRNLIAFIRSLAVPPYSP